jgi:hypothetical protein
MYNPCFDLLVLYDLYFKMLKQFKKSFVFFFDCFERGD